MILEFTVEDAHTCTSGDWKQIKLRKENLFTNQDDTSDFIPQPAYTLNGSLLTIDLNSNVCDGGHQLRGELNDLGVAGNRRSIHMFGGEKLGTFIGVPLSP